jgi:hypothetical protein
MAPSIAVSIIYSRYVESSSNTCCQAPTATNLCSIGISAHVVLIREPAFSMSKLYPRELSLHKIKREFVDKDHWERAPAEEPAANKRATK